MARAVTLRVARGIAALVAFLSAIVGLIRLIGSGWRSALDFLPWVGFAYLVLGVCVVMALAVWATAEEPRGERWFLRVLFAGVLAVVGWGLWRSLATWDSLQTKLFLDLTVLAGLGTVAWFGLDSLQDHLRAKAASVKECPDCLEDVKCGARVCRYCGFRFSSTQG